jgi:hypothetical protein
MSANNSKLYGGLLIYSALIFFAAYITAQKFGIPVYYIVLLSVYFTGFSFILNKQLQSALQDQNKNKFTHTFLALTALKMFSCLIILLFGLYFTQQNKLALGICTMGYYMLYTMLEVWHWINRLKNH